MCGIIGLFSKRKHGVIAQEVNAFKNHLTLDVIRGKDSTGACAVTKKTMSVFKVATHPMNAFATEEWEEFEKEMRRDGRILFGHNRAATRGSVTTENAHPFVEDNIILVHNGTLWNHEHLNKSSEVDSHAIAVALSKNPNIDEVIDSVKGAYALIWYDTNTGKAHFCRNNERPLWMGENDDMLVLSSEAPIGHLVYNRENIKLNWTEVKVDTLYTFSRRALESRTLVKKPVHVHRTNTQNGNSNIHSAGGAGNYFGRVGERDVPKLVAASTSPMSLTSRDGQRAKLLFSLTEAKASTSNTILAYGKIISPEIYKNYDVVSEWDSWELDDVKDFLAENPFFSGYAHKIVNSSCGPTVRVQYEDLNIYTTAQEVPSIRFNVPIPIRDYILDKEVCEECGDKLDILTFHANDVQIDPATKKLVIVCHKCISSEMHEADETIGKAFDDYRDSSLQTRQRLGEKFKELLAKFVPEPDPVVEESVTAPQAANDSN